MINYLNKTGLAYYHRKIKELLNGKASSEHTHDNATTIKDGFMSSDDKMILNNLSKDAILLENIAPVGIKTTIAGYVLDARHTDSSIKNSFAARISSLENENLSKFTDYSSQLTNWKSTNVKSLYTSSICKIGRLVVFMADIGYTGSSSCIILGSIPKELEPVKAFQQNTITDKGQNVYFFIDDSVSSKPLKFGITVCDGSKPSVTSDTVRVNMVYMTKS